MKLIPIAVLSWLSLTGCTSHLYNIPSQKSLPVIAHPFKGTIAAGDARKTFILESSTIVAHASNNKTFQLIDLKTYPGCGMPLLITYFSFGLIPGTIPEPMKATIEVVGDQKTSKVTYELQLIYRYSLWENLNFLHNDNVVVSRALAWSYADGETSR